MHSSSHRLGCFISSGMPFELEDAIRLANQAIAAQCDRHLSDLETTVLQGALQKLDYDQIAIQTNYATSYISQDVAPNLWRKLSQALGEKVRKGNCITALQRYAERLEQQLPNLPASEPPPPSPSQAREESGSSLEQNGSRSSPSSQAYITRPPLERRCYEALLQPGSLVRIKAPRDMGKTTFISHVLEQLAPRDYRLAHLSLEMADRAIHFSDLNRFLRWFCLNMSRELNLPNLVNEYWDEAEMGAKVSCTAYFEEYLLVQDQRPLVLCLDNVDVLFPYPAIYEDFFGLLRSWHEKARTRETWSKLRLVVIHATDVYIRLKLHQSPFNVGLPLELPEFTPAQVQQFAALFQLDLGTELTVLIQLLGGHPVLLAQAFTYLNDHPGLPLGQLLADATTESSIFGHHLREQLLTLENEPTLAAAFHQVIHSEGPVALAPMAAYQLQSMGLIQLSGNRATPRCKLYSLYFRDRLPNFS